MRKLILIMSITLDGFVGGPNGEIDWIFKTMSGSAAAWTVDKIWHAGAHLMGRKTLNDMAAYWPKSSEVFAAPMSEIPKIVFSKSNRNSELRSQEEYGSRRRRSWMALPICTTVGSGQIATVLVNQFTAG